TAGRRSRSWTGCAIGRLYKHPAHAALRSNTHPEKEPPMTRRIPLLAFTAAAALWASSSFAQETLKVGALNSYKSQTQYLQHYKRGIDLALEEINKGGGIAGRKLEVISRDDGGNPGDAVRVAEELVTREGVTALAGTFLSHVGLAVTEYAGKNKVFFLAAE